jgi:DNA replication ATP-dependent helicase Dna2
MNSLGKEPQYRDLLSSLEAFVRRENAVAHAKLEEVWSDHLVNKQSKGKTQQFTRIEPGIDHNSLWAYLEGGDSRFREGDFLRLHLGDAWAPLATKLSLEHEDEERWLLRGKEAALALASYTKGPCYADPDGLDFLNEYLQVLDEVSQSEVGRELLLPLISGDLDIEVEEQEVRFASSRALEAGLNQRQARAVGAAYGAQHIACIQGPPGTGKTAVLAFLAELLVARGERVYLTSHTHMAINNALSKVAAKGIPTVKIGRPNQTKGLSEDVPVEDSLSSWDELPAESGFVVGATPFASMKRGLKGWTFDTVIFDEASQVTIPLALMAMRMGKKFIFIGDHKQLPPVILSESVLGASKASIFSRLTALDADHCEMLTETYRMNQDLAQWPSQAFYCGELVSAGANRMRRLHLTGEPPELADVLEPAYPGVFIRSPGVGCHSTNHEEAKLVARLCCAAAQSGVPLEEIGIVTPFRSHGRVIRELLSRSLGHKAAKNIVSDTVERMQGQERELVIISLAATDKAYLALIAEFFFQPERLNVSITRPKTKLIVIGPSLRDANLSNDPAVQSWVDLYAHFTSQLHEVEVAK